MSTVLEQHTGLQESVECNAKCNRCGARILFESSLSGDGVAIPHRTVVGSFVQFLHEGEPFGPWWAFCQTCVGSGHAVSPVKLPEVQTAYRKIRKEI